MPTDTEIEHQRKRFREKRIESFELDDIFAAIANDEANAQLFLQAFRNGNTDVMGAAGYVAGISEVMERAEDDVNEWLAEEPTRDQLTREEIRYDDLKQAGVL